MRIRFFIVFLSVLLLAGCADVTETEVDEIAYRWEMYDLNFTYPEELNIYEDRQIIFNDDIFDTIIITESDLANAVSIELGIEIMARQNVTVEDMLTGFDGKMDYEDKGVYRAGDDKFKKICYDFFGSPRCSYLIEKNEIYYQFNLSDEYRDDFLRSLEFVE